jgi:hypothetical protein
MTVNRSTLERLFTFDIEGGRIFWKTPPYNHPRLLGKEAGSARPTHNKKRYWVIKINKKAWKRGHLIFFMASGRWPKPCIDHIDGNSLNDKISNLRKATIMQNAWNHRSRRKQSLLPMGVRKTPDSGRYEARIAYKKVQIHLGTYATPRGARIAYLAKRKELYGEFAGC